MHKTHPFSISTLASLIAVACFNLTGCAGIQIKSSNQVNIEPADRIFLQVAPFDTLVLLELKRVGLDPSKTHDDLVSELHYQFYLKHWEETKSFTRRYSTEMIV